MVSHRLDQWGYPYDSPVNETLTLITAELAANAVRHGHVPGRDFHLRLTATPEVLRVEVTDTRIEQMPPPSVHEASDDAESGRGLLLVTRLATRWGADPRSVAPARPSGLNSPGTFRAAHPWASIPRGLPEAVPPVFVLRKDVTPSCPLHPADMTLHMPFVTWLQEDGSSPLSYAWALVPRPSQGSLPRTRARRASAAPNPRTPSTPLAICPIQALVDIAASPVEGDREVGCPTVRIDRTGKHSEGPLLCLHRRSTAVLGQDERLMMPKASAQAHGDRAVPKSAPRRLVSGLPVVRSKDCRSSP
ncbi:ATP-binding protein [Streptomyces sp. INA 01156]